MAENCEFAERYCEQAVRQELTGRSGAYYVPTQLLENEVGFDVAVMPRGRVRFRLFHRPRDIWEIIGRPAPPGIILTPQLFNLEGFSGTVSGRWFSLMLQMKRAKRVIGHNGKHWKHWRKPYFQSESVRQPQHRHLCTLETNLRRRAYVRYVSPSFLTLAEISALIDAGLILENSVFISPSRVGGHKRWTYVGGDGSVRLNPDDDDNGPATAQTGLYFLEPSRERDEVPGDESFIAHLAELATGAQEVLATLAPEGTDWPTLDVERILEFFPEQVVQLIRQYVIVVEALLLLDATWLIGFQES
jgi:hypothetical protein